tara:strand:+ start:14275 stop:14790 length:516 start_codon:yes stop_codon:yes gene_type:complete
MIARTIKDHYSPYPENKAQHAYLPLRPFCGAQEKTCRSSVTVLPWRWAIHDVRVEVGGYIRQSNRGRGAGGERWPTALPNQGGTVVRIAMPASSGKVGFLGQGGFLWMVTFALLTEEWEITSILHVVGISCLGWHRGCGDAAPDRITSRPALRIQKEGLEAGRGLAVVVQM